jgi:ATP-dependent Clp protease ATP-binding subunit ClpA
MFERYTELARLVIFRARHEAQSAGSDFIEPEHLLLGLLREDSALLARFLPAEADVEAFHRELQQATPVREPKAGTTEMPLSHPAKRALAYGAEEAERMHHRHIGHEHILLGLLRESSPASRILEKYGVTLQAVRSKVLAQSGMPKWGERAAGAAAGSSVSLRNSVEKEPFSSTRAGDGTLVIETHRFHESHEITLIERLKLSDDGKTLKYSQELRGPKKVHHFTIDFDVS